jgi:hypothetical protein
VVFHLFEQHPRLGPQIEFVLVDPEQELTPGAPQANPVAQAE